MVLCIKLKQRIYTITFLRRCIHIKMIRSNIGRILLLCGLLVSVSSLSIAADSDVIEVQTKHVLENDNLLLVCNTTVQPDIDEFYWIKNDTSKTNSTFYQSGWKLEFIDIRRESSGIYACHAINNMTGDNTTLVAFKVDVQYPAEINEMDLWPTLITVNETFNVSCGFHGNPEPTWSIMKNNTGRRVMSATASADVLLWNNYVMCGDSGMWVCTGANRLNKGVNVTRGYYLTVLCSAQPDPDKRHVYDYKGSIGSNVTMALDVAGDPDPTYTWSRGDNKSLGNIVVETNAQGTNLTIIDVGPTDFGKYTLRMANSIGAHESHFQLTAYGYPGKPFNFTASNITYNSVDLSWISGFDSGTTQSFQIMKWTNNVYKSMTTMITGSYKDGGVGQRWSYHLTGLNGDTRYKLKVMAQNWGNQTLSDSIVLSTPSAPPPMKRRSEVTIIVPVCVGLVVLGVLGIVVWRLFRSRRGHMQIENKKIFTENLKNKSAGTFSVNGEK